MLQQCLNGMCMFSYHARDQKLLWKRKNEGWRKRPLEKANTFFFLGGKNASASVVTIAPAFYQRSGLQRCWPVEFISLDIEEPQDRW